MIGFFMAASVKRWWRVVNAFINLCGTVRNLQMMLLACDAPDDEAKETLRFGVMSAKLLSLEFSVRVLPTQEQAAAEKQGWHDLEEEACDISLESLQPQEAEALKRTSDPSGTLWIWIGTYLGALAGRGHIHFLAGPILARCMVLSSQGLGYVLAARSSVTVQAPFIYAQMLASLVHISNICTAVSFGLTSGTFAAKRLAGNNQSTLIDLQDLLVAAVFGALGPVVYQALLEVSIAIAQPFSNSKALIRTDRLLEQLVTDLQDGIRSSISFRLSGTAGVQRGFEAAEDTLVVEGVEHMDDNDNCDNGD